VEFEPGLIAASCTNCNGALLSLIQYRYWLDNHAKRKVDLKTRDKNEIYQEPEGARICPKCRKLMSKYRIGSATNNRLDLCSHCDEAWLDRGEWALLRELDLDIKLPSVFTEAWQRNIRKEKQLDKLKEHFVKEFGENDFEKITEFKEWLDTHPESAKIKHYINTNFEI